MDNPGSSRLDRIEALVAAYVETSAKELQECRQLINSVVETSAKETAALKEGLQESRQLLNSFMETSAKETAALKEGLQESRQLLNSFMETSAKETAALKEGLQESRQLLNSFMETSAKEIKESRQLINSVARTAQANSTEIAQLKRERQASDRQIAELGKLLADYIATSREERSTMFEIIQSLNDSRVETGETMVSMANSLIIIIHQLPQQEDTLWLRLLGKGKVQEGAIDELERLPKNNPFRNNTLQVFYSLFKDLEANRTKYKEDQELVMRLSPLYIEDREKAVKEGIQQGMQQGIQQGMQQGIQEERYALLETWLKNSFGDLDPELKEAIVPMLELSREDFASLLLQLSSLSRQQILERFGK